MYIIIIPKQTTDHYCVCYVHPLWAFCPCSVFLPSFLRVESSVAQWTTACYINFDRNENTERSAHLEPQPAQPLRRSLLLNSVDSKQHGRNRSTIQYTWTEVKIQSTTVTKSQGAQTTKACSGEKTEEKKSHKIRSVTIKDHKTYLFWQPWRMVSPLLLRDRLQTQQVQQLMWYKHFHIYNTNRRHRRDVPQLVHSSTRKGRKRGLSPPHTSREDRRGTPVFSLHSKRLFLGLQRWSRTWPRNVSDRWILPCHVSGVFLAAARGFIYIYIFF